MKLLFLVALFLTILPLHAQTDDFNDGNDAGWTRFAPLLATGTTTYTFPNGGYRLSSGPSPNPQNFGPARAAAFRQADSYTDFFISADITGWDPATDTSLGFLARLQPNPAPGNVSGYSLTYQGNDRDIEINRISAEAPTKISAGRILINLDPAKIYRLVFFSYGEHLEGRVYEVTNLANPLVTVTATDSDFTAGTNGLIVFSEQNTLSAATFDNYAADAGAAPQLLFTPSTDPSLQITWNAQAALCWRLESSTTLLSWQPQPAAPLNSMLNQILLPKAALEEIPQRFYRFAKGPATP